MVWYEECLGDMGLEPINEAFKGKSKKLLELEAMVGKNREKYFDTFKVAGSYYTDPDFIKIGDKIADIFGFKVVDFNLINDPSPNACTIPVGISIHRNIHARLDTAVDDWDNMKYTLDSLSAFIRVTSGMWSNRTFTHGEVTAIIIHEVGHNFQDHINKSLATYCKFVCFLEIVTDLTLVSSIGGFPQGMYNLIMHDPRCRAELNNAVKRNALGKIVELVGNVVGLFRVIIYEVMEIAGRLTLGIPAGLIKISDTIVKGISSPVTLIFDLALAGIRKSEENVSDTFASDLGYGPELISALTKMDLDPEASTTAVGRICKKIPVFDSVCTLFGLPTMMVSNLFSSHPISPKRAVNIVRDLEREMNKDNVSPKMKKEIQMQIDEIKEMLESYSKIDTALDPAAMRKLIYQWNLKYEKDPKGFIQRTFSKKNLIESVGEQEFPEFFDF